MYQLFCISLQGKVVKGEGSEAYFFVEWHVVCDMAAWKLILGVEGDGSRKCPCPLCMGTTAQHLDDVLLGAGGTPVWLERDMSRCIFPLPLSRFHPCGMHCYHRISERLLLEVMKVCTWQCNPIRLMLLLTTLPGLPNPFHRLLTAKLHLAILTTLQMQRSLSFSNSVRIFCVF